VWAWHVRDFLGKTAAKRGFPQKRAIKRSLSFEQLVIIPYILSTWLAIFSTWPECLKILTGAVIPCA